MTDLDITRLRAMAGTADVEIVTDSLEVVVAGFSTRGPLTPRSIVRVGELYLVETAEAPDDWYMGQLMGSSIVCHGAYGRLEDAIRAL